MRRLEQFGHPETSSARPFLYNIRRGTPRELRWEESWPPPVNRYAVHTEQTVRKKTRLSRWRPPFLEVVRFFLLFSFSIGLSFRKKQGARIKAPFQPPKLLADRISRPTWDGAYPYLVIPLALPRSRSSKFHSSIEFEQPTLRHKSRVNQFEVDLHSGMFILRQTDLFVPDIMPLALTRTYHVWFDYPTAFGNGATHPYDIRQFGDTNPYTYMELYLEDWREINFPRISEGTGYGDAVYRHMETTSEFYNAQIFWNGVGWTVQLHDGWRMIFPRLIPRKDAHRRRP